jgi:AcrR family transcriptional regulator
MTSSRKPRGAYHHGDLRHELVRASIALIEEQGVEALTLRALAKRLGVTHAAPQHHFASKTDLLWAVAEEGFAELGAALERAAGRHDAALDKLKAAGVAYVAFATRHPSHFRVMFGPHITRADPRAKRVSDVAYQVLLDAAAGAARAAGVPEQAETVAVAAWSLVHGLATLWLDGALRGGATTPAQLKAVAVAVTDLVGAAVTARTGA